MEIVEMKQENLFSRKIRAGKRTYFFDVKSTKSAKDFYLIITESRRTEGEQYEKHKLFLYKEDFKKFRDALEEAVHDVEQRFSALVEKAVEV